MWGEKERGGVVVVCVVLLCVFFLKSCCFFFVHNKNIKKAQQSEKKKRKKRIATPTQDFEMHSKKKNEIQINNKSSQLQARAGCDAYDVFIDTGDEVSLIGKPKKKKKRRKIKVHKNTWFKNKSHKTDH